MTGRFKGTVDSDGDFERQGSSIRRVDPGQVHRHETSRCIMRFAGAPDKRIDSVIGLGNRQRHPCEIQAFGRVANGFPPLA